MKRFKKLALVLVAALIVSMTAPSVVPNMGVSVSAASKKVKLNKTKIALTTGRSFTLKLKNAKASKVKWSSSNKKVATVSKKGVVKAKKAGTTKVTAKYGKKKFTCSVKVVKPTAPAPAPVTPAPVAPAPVVTPAPAPATPTPAPSVAPAPVVTNPTEPIAIQNPNPVFNGASLSGMTATRSTEYRDEYNMFGTFTNTSKYTLSSVSVEIVGYASNGVAVCTDKSLNLYGTLEPGKSYAINNLIISQYDIAYFTINSVTPSFQNSNEPIDISYITKPSTCTGTLGAGMTVDSWKVTATHNYNTFDTLDGDIEFTLHYTWPANQEKAVNINVKCVDAAGNVLATNTISDTLSSPYYGGSTSVNCWMYGYDIPINTSAFVVEVNAR